MKLLANENFPLSSYHILKDKGYDILDAKWFGRGPNRFGQYILYLKKVWVPKPLQRQYIRHIGIELPSVPDKEVMEIAMSENRIVITFDSDYGELVFKQGYTPKGVIYLRWKEFTPNFPGEFIDDIIKQGLISFENQFTVISENQIRQRQISR